MFKTNTAAMRVGVTLAVLIALGMTLVLPLLSVGSGHFVSAAQVTSRSIDFDDSTPGATTDYQVSFTIPAISSTTAVDAIVLQYCDDSPIVGVACNDAVEAGDSFDWNDVDASNEGGSCALTPGDWAVDAGASDTDGWVYTNGTTPAEAITPACVISFDIDGVDNADTAKTFYVRMHIYDDESNIPYTGAGTDFDEDNASLAYDDYGAVAMATANVITIEARVQERLTFTVGGDVDDASDCNTISGTTIDLGVLDNANINRATVDQIAGNLDGICTEVTTNAAGGVVVSYTTTDLTVSGASCGEDDIDLTEISTDQCLNWDNDASAAVVAGTEQWGIGVIGTPENGTTSDQFGANIAADYDETSWTNTVHADPDATSPVELANSGGAVVDQESLFIDAAATAAITTPTGLYEASLVFIATGTF